MKRFLLMAAVVLSGSGCRLVCEGLQTSAYECAYAHNVAVSEARHVAMARAALRATRGQRGSCAASPDYARGFVAGYSDYLDLGGTGLPPPVPHAHYWKDKYFTAQGQRAVQLWYSGYEDGTAMAMQSGYRDLETSPSPACCPAPPGCRLSEPALRGPPLQAGSEEIAPGPPDTGRWAVPQRQEMPAGESPLGAGEPQSG